MKILVVDNDKADLEQLCAALRRVASGAEVVPFFDPLLAVKYMVAHGGEIGLVFTALLMLPIDGFLLIKQVRRWVPGCPTVVVNHTETWEFRSLASERGANAFLVKPVTDEMIQDVLREAENTCCHF